eukprot:CAMPEP_0198147078 /NCGR_PEP_ID=MMETSP1443-20131203/33190_1 /TAXON_ID=186043 /ORGANISM="Entomoneis sp., Strain CCMP2396" /LENGTH=221 /DNA_ID=CAMNT_0043811233 /DNA_START=255 /DNA_END=917 /DNA_ORIENTATION=+
MAAEASSSNETTQPSSLHRELRSIKYGSPFFDNSDGVGSPSAIQLWNSSQTAMVILNSPIVGSPNSANNIKRNEAFEALWNQSTFHVCADGGANRLYEYYHNPDDEENLSTSTTTTSSHVIPDLITGDLDSVKPHVRSFYESLGVPIIKHYDQNYNDLDKSLKSIINKGQQKQEQEDGSSSEKSLFNTCFIYGAFGGRFDQEMASIQALFVHSNTFTGGLW